MIEQALGAGVRVYQLGPGVMERVADTVTPQPLLAVVAFVDVGLDALAGASLVVVCADVRDPGNAGTVLRSAEAAGADGVICCDGSVDVYNPKTVRASAGADASRTEETEIGGRWRRGPGAGAAWGLGYASFGGCGPRRAGLHGG